MFTIATWNVNSLRVRLTQVVDWLVMHQPDVLALQEIKVEDKDFPTEIFAQLGYAAVFSGQKTYNGVAILSKLPAQEIMVDNPYFEDPQRRILAATVNNIRVVNLYVPNGDSVGSEKYEYKLSWMKKMTDFLRQELIKYPHLVVLGDFNVAPDDRDVYEPELWKDKVLCSEPERQALQAWCELGLADSFRLFTAEIGFYSWWDYRAAAFRRDLGLRIDLILASEKLAATCESCIIDKAPRKLERPSDHTPVFAKFKL